MERSEHIQRVLDVLAERLEGHDDVHAAARRLFAAVAPTTAVPVGKCLFDVKTHDGTVQQCIDGVTEQECEFNYNGTWSPGVCSS